MLNFWNFKYELQKMLLARCYKNIITQLTIKPYRALYIGLNSFVKYISLRRVFELVLSNLPNEGGRGAQFGNKFNYSKFY